MKYYYLKGALIIDMAEGFAIACKLEKVKLGRQRLKRFTAEIVYIKGLLKEQPELAVYLTPLSKQQALDYFLRMRAKDAIYRVGCEIRWRLPKHKQERNDDDVMKIALTNMMSYHLDAPKSCKPEYFYWRRKTFEFVLS